MVPNYLYLPYVPNRQHKKVLGRPTPYSYIHRIAYTEAMRGLYDEIPTILFYGAPFALLKDVCVYLYKIMCGRVQNLIIDYEHACRVKNGKCYWRTMIKIVGLDEQFISLKEFIRLIVCRMMTICNCKIRHYKLDAFVNL